MTSFDEKSDMLRDLAIFEYVSGDQSSSAQRNFEDMMKNDPQLRADVDAEKALRADIAKAGVGDGVSMNNIDGLLARIDIESDVKNTASTDEVRGAQTSDPETSSSGDKASNAPRVATVISGVFSRATSRATSLAAAASVAFIAVGFAVYYVDITKPNFNVLSNKNASQQVDFASLVEQGRLAKLTVSSSLSQQEVNDMLGAYGLSTFEAGTRDSDFYVYTASKISSSQLAAWRADTRVDEVKLFTVQ